MSKLSFAGDSDEDRLLRSRVEDAAGAAEHYKGPKFIGFLDMHQQQVAAKTLAACGFGCESAFWGGFEGAERAMLGLFDPGVQPDPALFPIGALRFTWKFGALTHRDFLGALLSLGVRREKLGDIAVGGNECTVLLDAVIADFVKLNLDKVGGSGVVCEPVERSQIEKRQEFQAIADTISSPRLDCVAASLLNLSRGQTGKLIESGAVSVDFEPAVNPALKVNEGATVSIRGHGRFIVDGIGPPTRKGRLRFAARRYL